MQTPRFQGRKERAEGPSCALRKLPGGLQGAAKSPARGWGRGQSTLHLPELLPEKTALPEEEEKPLLGVFQAQRGLPASGALGR